MKLLVSEFIIAFCLLFFCDKLPNTTTKTSLSIAVATYALIVLFMAMRKEKIFFAASTTKRRRLFSYIGWN